MTDLITEYTDYDAFAREWYADALDEHGVTLQEAREQGIITDDDTQMLWQLLGELSEDEVLVRIPEWLADEKVGYVDGATPTEFVGRIDRETDKAILLAESASARSLKKLAHRIHQLESGDADTDRTEWVADRRQELRERFERRDDATTLQDEWLPKSQLLHVVRRRN